MYELSYIEEPNILFGYNQKGVDPRDGLALFGPHETIYGIRSGVIATKEGLGKFAKYLEFIQRPVYNKNTQTRPMFPGFETVFNTKWEAKNIFFKEITNLEIETYLFHGNTHKRTYDLVSLFLEKIIEANKNYDENISLWFVIVPDTIYKYCRPLSVLPDDLVKTKPLITKGRALKYSYEPSFFDEMNIESKKKEEEALSYNYDAQFHNQLKARLLPYTIPTQIIRESTLDWKNYTNAFNFPLRDFSKIEGHLAWTLSTSVFYKAGGKPWKLSDIRKGVCYLGLVYKKINKSKNPTNACCAAQMFLDNGDGTVFKGEVGPWYNPESKEYHLNINGAKALLTQAIHAYYDRNKCNPKEMFIHSRTRFNDVEWSAFQEVTPEGTNLVGVTINRREPIKLYKTEGEYSVLRGLAYKVSKYRAYLWTIGYVPHIGTALSSSIPNALYIEINKGYASIEQVLKDILALTKLNYNACIYGDGIPVTLRFANNIGEILTSSLDIQSPPLAFKYYI
jgi:hypothetical protein